MLYCPSYLGEERDEIIAEARRAAAEAKFMAEEKKKKESIMQTSYKKTLKEQRVEEEQSRMTSSHQRQMRQETERYDKSAQTSQTQKNNKQIILQRYDGRRYTAEELNQAVKNAYTAVDKAYRDIRTLIFGSFIYLTTLINVFSCLILFYRTMAQQFGAAT